MEVIATSKTQSVLFGKNCYLISRVDLTNGLTTGLSLKYGYLENTYKKGAKRGWFISKYSMSTDDLIKRYDFENKKVNVKLK